MFATSQVIEAARKDRNRFLANPRGSGYLTRDERWREAIAYCRRRDNRRLMTWDEVVPGAFECWVLGRIVAEAWQEDGRWRWKIHTSGSSGRSPTLRQAVLQVESYMPTIPTVR